MRDPSSYGLVDEPLEPGDPIDYRYLFALMTGCVAREEERGKTLDAKITALLAGVVAFIGFSFRLQSTIWNAGASLVYVFPLVFLFAAFMTKSVRSAPDPESLEAFFREYPVTALREAIAAILLTRRANERLNDLKASRLIVASVLTAVATVVVLIEQFLVDIFRMSS